MSPAAKFQSFDTRFDALLHPDSQLERLCTGFVWAEGPIYFAEGDYLLWSDIPNDRTMRWSDAEGLSVFREPAGYSNGHYRDLQGRLISCEHGNRRVSRTNADGTIVTLAESYQGKRLNSPNDVVVKSDGTIWFTDPPYGILSDHEGHQAESELGACFVFRLDPTSGDLTIVASDRDKPNGLAFNQDETILYVSDTGGSHKEDGWHHIFAYELSDGRSLGSPRIFAEINPGLSDGFRLDKNGYLFTSSADSIQVYAPDGHLLGKIMVPETSANCTFGGPHKDRLYICATTSLYSITLNTQGIQIP